MRRTREQRRERVREYRKWQALISTCASGNLDTETDSFRLCWRQAFEGFSINALERILVKALIAAPHQQRIIEMLARGKPNEAIRAGEHVDLEKDVLPAVQLVALFDYKHRKKAMSALMRRDPTGNSVEEALEFITVLWQTLADLMRSSENATLPVCRVVLRHPQQVDDSVALIAARRLLREPPGSCDFLYLRNIMLKLGEWYEIVGPLLLPHLRLLRRDAIDELFWKCPNYRASLEKAMKQKWRLQRASAKPKHLRALSRK